MLQESELLSLRAENDRKIEELNKISPALARAIDFVRRVALASVQPNIKIGPFIDELEAVYEAAERWQSLGIKAPRPVRPIVTHAPVVLTGNPGTRRVYPDCEDPCPKCGGKLSDYEPFDYRDWKGPSKPPADLLGSWCCEDCSALIDHYAKEIEE